MQDDATSIATTTTTRQPGGPPETLAAAMRRAVGRLKCDDVLGTTAEALLNGGEMEITLTVYQAPDAGDVRMTVSLRERAPKRSILRFRNLPMPEEDAAA